MGRQFNKAIFCLLLQNSKLIICHSELTSENCLAIFVKKTVWCLFICRLIKFETQVITWISAKLEERSLVNENGSIWTQSVSGKASRNGTGWLPTARAPKNSPHKDSKWTHLSSIRKYYTIARRINSAIKDNNFKNEAKQFHARWQFAMEILNYYYYFLHEIKSRIKFFYLTAGFY